MPAPTERPTLIRSSLPAAATPTLAQPAPQLDSGDENAGTQWYEGWTLVFAGFVAASLAVGLLGRRSGSEDEPG